jgi:pimeloyl-ACP methyl ester carboxylesterase
VSVRIPAGRREGDRPFVFAAVFSALVAFLGTSQSTLPLHACAPQGVPARCGRLLVPEDRSETGGRKIGLNIVVIPSLHKPAQQDAFTYLAGGPGGAAASEMPSSALSIWPGVHERHDIVLVDQRGTGSSNALMCPEPTGELGTASQRRAYVRSCLDGLNGDPTQYGTRAAVQDLESVRVALGYGSFDVYGTSYGATVAQMYLKRYPKSVRTLILDGATFTDVPFFSRYARNGEHALAQVAKECAAQRACAKAFPAWRAELTSLIRKWNNKPLRRSKTSTITGDGLAGIVQGMMVTAASAARIPLLVSHAAAGHYKPLIAALGAAGGLPRSMMYWTIMCNEPWVGLDSHGPWGTFLDGLTAVTLAQARIVCAFIPKRTEAASAWTRPHSRVPTLVLAGEADPQDPIGNLPNLGSALPNARVVIAPGQGHAVGQYGCLGALVSRFVDHGTAKSLDTRCARAIGPPSFVVR